eukprot:COSAG02_NODE_6159_length_3757_cov_2.144615_3_plen_71_part_00
MSQPNLRSRSFLIHLRHFSSTRAAHVRVRRQRLRSLCSTSSVIMHLDHRRSQQATGQPHDGPTSVRVHYY